jgi:hypothetical protein
MDLLELGLLWSLCGSRATGSEMAWWPRELDWSFVDLTNMEMRKTKINRQIAGMIGNQN